jgi:hypothetical protein
MKGHTYRDNSTRARWAIIFLAVVIALGIVVIFFHFRQITIYKEMLSEAVLSEEELELHDTLYSIAVDVRSLWFLATAIPFLMWFHRAFSNIKSMSDEVFRYSPNWGLSGFFIPFYNLIHP